MDNAWYEKRYNETVLNCLSAVETAEKLNAIGPNVVLLCMEEPPRFCHRHLVSRWFLKHHLAAAEFDLTRT